MRINKKDVASILIFIALILAFVLLVNNITNKNSGRELQIVRDAVKNAALTCYAVEGMYPDNLEYLREHYNLSYLGIFPSTTKYLASFIKAIFVFR